MINEQSNQPATVSAEMLLAAQQQAAAIRLAAEQEAAKIAAAQQQVQAVRLALTQEAVQILATEPSLQSNNPGLAAVNSTQSNVSSSSKVANELTSTTPTTSTLGQPITFMAPVVFKPEPFTNVNNTRAVDQSSEGFSKEVFAELNANEGADSAANYTIKYLNDPNVRDFAFQYAAVKNSLYAKLTPKF